MLIYAHATGFRIGEFYTPCMYRKESSSITFSKSVKYGVETIINLLYYIFDKKRFL